MTGDQRTDLFLGPRGASDTLAVRARSRELDPVLAAERDHFLVDEL